MFDAYLVITDQPAGLDEPSEGTFDEPSLRQHLKSLYGIASLDDLKVDLPVARQAGDLTFECSCVTAVGPDPFEPAIAGRQRGEQ